MCPYIQHWMRTHMKSGFCRMKRSTADRLVKTMFKTTKKNAPSLRATAYRQSHCCKSKHNSHAPSACVHMEWHTIAQHLDTITRSMHTISLSRCLTLWLRFSHAAMPHHATRQHRLTSGAPVGEPKWATIVISLKVNEANNDRQEDHSENLQDERRQKQKATYVL